MEAREVLAQNIERLILKKVKAEEYTSVEHFATSNKLQKSLLSRVLNLKADLKLSSLEKIAKALEVPLADLLKSKSR